MAIMDFTSLENWLLLTQETQDKPLRLSQHWVGGSWQETLEPSDKRVVINPNRNTKLIDYTTSQATREQAFAAAESASLILTGMEWSERLHVLRQLTEKLRQNRSLLAHALQVEGGKPAWDAFLEINSAIHHCQGVVEGGSNLREAFFASARLSANPTADTINLQGIGICAGYLPFSTPVLTFCVYFSSALLAGCPLVVFSSGHATIASLILGYIADSLALPRGSLSIVLGEFADFRSSVSDKRIAGVFYIGSKEHGEQLQKDAVSQRKKRLIIQGGGKNSVIVHSSADLPLAVKAVTLGVCKTSGQLPTSTSRVFVHQAVLAEFCERIVASFQHLSIGPCDEVGVGEHGGPIMGPLVSSKSVERFLRFQTMARREAKITVQHGKKLYPSDSRDGFYVQPGVHLLEEFNPSSLYQSNLLFAPDLAIYSFDKLSEALDTVNHSGPAYSLSFMGDPALIQDQALAIQVPNILINTPTVELESYLPYCSRGLLNQAPLWGIGLALSLCYPQMLRHNPRDAQFLHNLSILPD